MVCTCHHWSTVHIHRYLADFDFRYSTKDISDSGRADVSPKDIGGKRLTDRLTDNIWLRPVGERRTRSTR